MRAEILPIHPDSPWLASWSALAAQSCSPFCSSEWVLAAIEAGYGRPQALLHYEGQELASVLPFVVRRGAWKVARSFPAGPSDRLEAAGLPIDPSLAAQEIREQVRVDLVDWMEWPSSVPPEANGWVVQQSVSPFLDLSSGPFTGASKSLMADVKKGRKNPHLRVRSSTPATAQEDLDHFFRFHSLRWKKRGLPGAFAGKQQRLHRAFLPQALAKEQAEMLVLEQNGSPIGVLYSLRGNGRTLYYQSGWAPPEKGISPGSLLIAAALENAVERGDSIFDFGRGDEPYKRRWGASGRSWNYRVVTPFSAVGKAGQSWIQRGFALESELRHRLEGGSWRDLLSAKRAGGEVPGN